jgi:ribosomal protein S18 acetylase RimI-like enzyme
MRKGMPARSTRHRGGGCVRWSRTRRPLDGIYGYSFLPRAVRRPWPMTGTRRSLVWLSSAAVGELGSIEVRDLRPEEIPEAVGVLARGMRDNPMHVTAYGDDPQRRVHCHASLMRALFRGFRTQQPICAVRGGVLLGVTGVAPVGTCKPTATQRMRLLPSVVALGPRTAARVGRWISRWVRRDLAEPHVHLGPLAVDAHLQRQGIGSLILREHCLRLDRAGEVGYLETDKPENVRFYERAGFEVIGKEPVIGVTTWYMRRAARSDPGS